MKKWLLLTTLLFSFLIVAIVIGADADRFPLLLKSLYDFPGGIRRTFHPVWILSFLLNKSALVFFPDRNPLASF